MIVNDDRFYGGKALVLKKSEVPADIRKTMFSTSDTEPGSAWTWFGQETTSPSERHIRMPERIYNPPTISAGWNIGLPTSELPNR